MLALGAQIRGRGRRYTGHLCADGKVPSALGICRLTHCPAHFLGTWRESGESTKEQMLINCCPDWVAVAAAGMLHKGSCYVRVHVT